MMASRKLGKTSVFKYLINTNTTTERERSFSDPSLWEDLV